MTLTKLIPGKYNDNVIHSYNCFAQIGVLRVCIILRFVFCFCAWLPELKSWDHFLLSYICLSNLKIRAQLCQQMFLLQMIVRIVWRDVNSKLSSAMLSGIHGYRRRFELTFHYSNHSNPILDKIGITFWYYAVCNIILRTRQEDITATHVKNWILFISRSFRYISKLFCIILFKSLFMACPPISTLQKLFSFLIAKYKTWVPRMI